MSHDADSQQGQRSGQASAESTRQQPAGGEAITATANKIASQIFIQPTAGSKLANPGQPRPNRLI